MPPLLPPAPTDAASRRADEEPLVARARARDDAAFSLLVDRYRPHVYAKAKAILGSDEAAEDACQETFLRAYRSLAGLRDSHAFFGWLLTIATNVCNNELEASQRMTTGLVSDGLPDASNRFEQSQLRAELTSLIAELSPRMSVLARLHYLQGFDQDDIASKMGMPLGTVSGTLTRARNEIRARLERNRRQEADLAPQSLHVRTQGVLATLCPFCGKHQLEWRRPILPGTTDRIETYCPQCSGLHGFITCWPLGKSKAVDAEKFFLAGLRGVLQTARAASRGTGHCPSCGARLRRVPPFASRTHRSGEARVAWRCSKCDQEADSRAAGLLLGSEPVQRFLRQNEPVINEDLDEWIRADGLACWRFHYTSLRKRARLAIVTETSSLHVLSATVDYGCRTISVPSAG